MGRITLGWRLGPAFTGVNYVDFAVTIHPNLTRSVASDHAKNLASSLLSSLHADLRFDLGAVFTQSAGRMALTAIDGIGSFLDPHAVSFALDTYPVLRDAVENRHVMTWTVNGSPACDPLSKQLVGDITGAGVAVPIETERRVSGIVVLLRLDGRPYVSGDVERCAMLGKVLGLALRAEQRALHAEHFVEQVRRRNVVLEGSNPFHHAITTLHCSTNAVMQRIVASAEELALSSVPLLVVGERGVGKEVLARALHHWRPRPTGAFVRVDPLDLPDDSHWSNLTSFGADVGTLYLDGIDRMPEMAQRMLAKSILRTTTGAPIRIVGSVTVGPGRSTGRPLHPDLDEAVGTVRLQLPPLRDRLDDLKSLVTGILQGLHATTGQGPWVVDAEGLVTLAEHSWPGNVRELASRLEVAAARNPPGPLNINVSGPSNRRKRSRNRWLTLEDHDREYIVRVLQHTNGKIYGPGGAALLLGVPPTTLQSRLAKLRILRTEFAQ